MDTKVDRYEGIDGLKTYAIIGIALMHILTNAVHISLMKATLQILSSSDVDVRREDWKRLEEDTVV